VETGVIKYGFYEAEVNGGITNLRFNYSKNVYKLSLLMICMLSKVKVGKHKGNKVLGSKYLKADLNANRAKEDQLLSIDSFC